MNLSISIIEGVIKPSSISCNQETKRASASSLREDYKEYPREVVLDLIDDFETYIPPTDPDFWKLKSVAHMMDSESIISMAFYPDPKTFHHSQWLFLQKINITAETVGFFAPYLTEEDEKATWGPMEGIPFCCLITEANLNESLEKIDKKIRNQFRNILTCFLEDTLNQGLCLTFTDHDEKLSTILWLKA